MSEIVLAAETGLFTVLFGLIAGIIGFVLLKPRFLEEIYGEMSAYLEDPEIQNAIRARFEAEAMNYIAIVLKYVHDNPDKVSPVVQGLFNDIAKALPVIQGAEGMKIDPNSIQAILPFLPAKWRGIATVASFFMGKQGGNTSQEAEQGKPFGSS